ncbi:hypothetical protein Nepgr_031260 [Nepenthes gracilis]|uniref:Uncharacterized protein n=1 Tax=Nepenthes gracilis TaxID=150966 RepID=A0AAD3TIH6_NEPGR|nr:hypothetical protein Nepgr_031260 [Nepenthes gracilis]
MELIPVEANAVISPEGLTAKAVINCHLKPKCSSSHLNKAASTSKSPSCDDHDHCSAALATCGDHGDNCSSIVRVAAGYDVDQRWFR